MWQPFTSNILSGPYQYRYPTWFYVLKMFLFGGQCILRKKFFARRWEKKGSVCSFYDSVSTKLLCKASSPSPFQLHLDWCLLGAPRWTPILWCVLAEQHSAAYSDRPKMKRISGQDNNLVINKLHCNPIKKKETLLNSDFLTVQWNMAALTLFSELSLAPQDTRICRMFRWPNQDARSRAFIPNCGRYLQTNESEHREKCLT